MYRPPGAPQPLAAEQAAWQQRPGRVPDQPGLYHQQQGAGVQPQGGYGYPPPRPSAAAAAHPPPPTADGRLRSVDELPPPFRPCFRFRYFNAIQNESWGAIWEGDSNVVISAPTGGGKTVLLELAVLRLLAAHLTPAGQFQHRAGHLKAVYLAPSRALVQEKVRDWGERFGVLGLNVRELTGDTDREGLEGLDTADVVCATPEKFDAVSRGGGLRFFSDIGLVLIDEVHLLSETRGASLEGVVARVKVVSKLKEMRGQPIGRVRYVAVSATVPNLQDLAHWLGAPPAGVKTFGEEMRPVKLRTVVRGYQPTKTDFLFERRLNDFIFQVVADHSSGKPSLVFCSSRKGTSETAAHLAREAAKAAGGRAGAGSSFVRDAAQAARLAAGAAGLQDKALRECLAAGVGYHHAAMEPQERAAVEALFVNQDLAVLCTTSTLAMGVNLPARLVVIKARAWLGRGTRRYVGSEAEVASGYQEYERSTCLQMVGRAGRPQYDVEGVAVIMTTRDHVRRYEQLVGGSEQVESTLKRVLPELLNAEITLRTITDVPQAIDWLRATYLYTRIRAAPAAYAVPRQPSAEALDRWLRDRLLLGALRELAEHGMVRLHDDGVGLEPSTPGIIMAQKYVRFDTMKALCRVPPSAGLPKLVEVLAESAELSGIKLRRSEKKILNEANHSDHVRFKASQAPPVIMNPAKPGKVLERIATGPHKLFILVNAALSDAPPDVFKLDYSLKQDMEQAVSVGARLAGAMVRLFEQAGKASETFNALLLQKSLRQRMWTDSRLETRQLSGIGPLIAQRLAGVHKLAQLAAVEPRRLEAMAQRHYPFGNDVRAALSACMPPPVSLQCQPVAWLPGGLVELEVTVERTGGGDAPSPARLLVGSLHDDALLLCRPLALESFPSPLVLRARTRSPVGGKGGAPVQVVASIVHERLVGVDQAIKVVVPPGVRLQGQACLPAPKQEPAQQQQQQQAGSGELGDSALDEASGSGGSEGPEPPATSPVKQRASGRGRKKAGPASGALQVMHRKLNSQAQPPAAAPAAPAAKAPAPALPSLEVAAPPLATAQPAAGAANAGGRSKWSSFVPAAVGGAGKQKQAGPLQQVSIQAALRWGAAAAAAGQAIHKPARDALQAAPAPPAAAFAFALQAPSLAASAQPGGLFSRFAQGSRRPTAEAAPARAGGSTLSWGQGRGLLGPTAAGPDMAQALQQPSFEGASAEAPAAKRPRLGDALPQPGAAATAPATARAVRPALGLPKLAWLSARFAQPPAPAAAAAPAAPPAQAQVPEDQAPAPAPLPDFGGLFASFL